MGKTSEINAMDTVQIESLVLINFKSYEEERFVFGQGVQVISGLNGMGKTNVLDALYYLGMCRSYFPLRDKELVRHGGDFFRLDSTYQIKKKTHRLVAKVKPGETKVFEMDQKHYETLAAHIGQLPVVLIAPNDTQLLSGFSEERRRFLDQTLCQVDAVYLEKLSTYNRLLLQRNAWLKASLGAPPQDLQLLDVLDQQMAEPAQYIAQARESFALHLSQQTKALYTQLSRGREEAGASYQSKLLKEKWLTLAKKSRSSDLRFGRTSEGIHKDDLSLLLDGYPARRFSSQGQLKSYVLALKLAQYLYIAEAKNLRPLLLMDDIFDKLDQERVEALLTILGGLAFGQVFITDTEDLRVPKALKAQGQKYTTFRIANSHIIPPD